MPHPTQYRSLRRRRYSERLRTDFWRYYCYYYYYHIPGRLNHLDQKIVIETLQVVYLHPFLQYVRLPLFWNFRKRITSSENSAKVRGESGKRRKVGDKSANLCGHGCSIVTRWKKYAGNETLISRKRNCNLCLNGSLDLFDCIFCASAERSTVRLVFSQSVKCSLNFVTISCIRLMFSPGKVRDFCRVWRVVTLCTSFYRAGKCRQMESRGNPAELQYNTIQ